MAETATAAATARFAATDAPLRARAPHVGAQPRRLVVAGVLAKGIILRESSIPGKGAETLAMAPLRLDPTTLTLPGPPPAAADLPVVAEVGVIGTTAPEEAAATILMSAIAFGLAVIRVTETIENGTGPVIVATTTVGKRTTVSTAVMTIADLSEMREKGIDTGVTLLQVLAEPEMRATTVDLLVTPPLEQHRYHLLARTHLIGNAYHLARLDESLNMSNDNQAPPKALRRSPVDVNQTNPTISLAVRMPPKNVWAPLPRPKFLRYQSLAQYNLDLRTAMAPAVQA